VRRDADGIRRYVHLGTGNYNAKTARLYTDVGLFTCEPDIAADVGDLFNVLTGVGRQRGYRRLAVAPGSLRTRTLALIDRETAHAEAGRSGRIIAKMNALVDPQVISALYRASQAGVEIDLIVRGICCLVPGIVGVSDRIRVRSIIGRFLEHSRVFYFGNAGDPECFIGSADWMPRNFDRRVETMAPITDRARLADLKGVLDVCLSDSRQAWLLREDGTYARVNVLDPDSATHRQLVEDAWGAVKRPASRRRT
jgi:polyphosphate kinase